MDSLKVSYMGKCLLTRNSSTVDRAVPGTMRNPFAAKSSFYMCRLPEILAIAPGDRDPVRNSEQSLPADFL